VYECEKEGRALDDGDKERGLHWFFLYLSGYWELFAGFWNGVYGRFMDFESEKGI
jgi:hypothetical protein